LVLELTPHRRNGAPLDCGHFNCPPARRRGGSGAPQRGGWLYLCRFRRRSGGWRDCASLFHIAWADGLASIAIGLLLASVAFVLANETRSLIAGEAVAPIVMERLKEARARIGCITSLDEVATLHLGPGKILVALTLALRRDSTTDAIEEAIREVTEALLRKAHERVVYVYVRPSDKA
jgi:hypothetical protein